VGTTVPDTFVAQAKKDDKAGKTAKDKKDAKTGVSEIKKGKDDKYRFFVRDADGKLLAMSGPGGFESMKDAVTVHRPGLRRLEVSGHSAL
jgi:hypothetical protein